VGLRAAHHSL